MESSRTPSRYRGGAGVSSSQAALQTPSQPPPPPPPPVITLQYFGSHLDLTHRWLDPRDEVIVEQQHCGGNTVYVYRDRISPNSALPRDCQLDSSSHLINNIQIALLSQRGRAMLRVCQYNTLSTVFYH